VAESPEHNYDVFEKDIFISYAHIDNESLSGDLHGWIARFHNVLELRLKQVRGKTATIWRDTQMRNHGYFEDTIAQELASVKLLLSIVTPRYIESEWCQREVNEFCKLAQMNGGIRIGNNKSRIIKAVKTPVSREGDKYPAEFARLLEYLFYEQVPEGYFREYDENLGDDMRRKFVNQIDRLSQDINDLLNQLDKSKEVSSNRGIVYLAETVYKLHEERDNLRSELKQHGFDVLPQQSLVATPDFEQHVKECLQQCDLSIHLIGEEYGMIPEGETKHSIVELQLQLAREAQMRCGQVVWMRKGLRSVSDERQEQFISNLQIAQDIELLQTSMDELKTIVHERLQSPEPSIPEISVVEDARQVYLIYDRLDYESKLVMEDLECLEDYLFAQGLDVISISFEHDDETAFRKEYEGCLRICDGVLIYCNQGNSLWLRSKLMDIGKSHGYGRDREFLAKAVYVTGERNKTKEKFKTHLATVIKHWGPFDPQEPEALQPFLTKFAPTGED